MSCLYTSTTGLKMAGEESGWCLIESDPGVFNALIDMLGVKGVSFEEVYGLDKEVFAALNSQENKRKILGFIFLFNWQRDRNSSSSSSNSNSSSSNSSSSNNATDSQDPAAAATAAAAAEPPPDTLFFPNQTVENACATQAILSVLLNQRKEIKNIGEDLKGLWEFIKDFKDPTMRGEAIGGWAPIQKSGEELRFNLMAVTTNPLEQIEDELKEQREVAESAAHRLESEGLGAEEAKQLEEARQAALSKIEVLEELKAQEQAKRAEWDRENARRRHDFTPFVLCALRHLARKGELVKAVRRATAAAAATATAAAAAGGSEKQTGA
ncbi:ubiquitin carboxyl-terminal hydrolase isozyme L5, putative [Eimeria maxima]|uniref:ubiquitinyl hydrolase 1 n=1 Tax=Eimeria maxima TaxID=5804 RepID=U6M4S6_EIMMA|nr:ubiquitin carboxyl-terminal hydrolase isozyme L5, putative [Eimeria maxima]CDJ57459.1 ubiquitin carboxyl-terminal hydrolase isozyme L5, putative [Eimeria maxima]